MDNLTEIFKMQQKLQNLLKTNYNQEFKNIMTLAIVDEIMESLRETPWKPWKKQQILDNEKYKEELVDVLHFFVNLCLASGMCAQELFDRYKGKMKINIERAKNGY